MPDSNRHLRKQRSIWYFQLAIPADLESLVGKKLISQSLKTDNIYRARELRDALIVEWRATFRRLRQQHGLPDAEDVLATARRLRAELEAGTKAPTQVASEWEHMDAALYQHWGPSEVWSAGELDAYRTASRIAAGESVITLSEAITLYLKTVGHRITPQTLHAKRKRLGALQTYLGDIPLERLDRRAAANYVTAVLLPMPVSPKTKADILGDLKAFSETLVRMGHAKTNPFARLRPLLAESTRGRSEESRRAWTDAELARLFTLLREGPGVEDTLWKATILAAYTGCRLNEIAEAKWQDVSNNALRVREAKTKSGLRWIPLHPLLLPWVSLWHGEGSQWILPGLLPGGQNQRRGHGLSKKFGYFKGRHGFESALTFHSLRHAFVTALERAQVPEPSIARLLGHAQRGFSLRQYSDGLPVEQLREAVAKVSYHEADSFLLP